MLETINNRYQIIDLIGKGGMGTVYRANDCLAEEVIALKRVAIISNKEAPVVFDDSVNNRLLLLNEFQTLSSLRHPNIISVLDYGFDTLQQPYFTMTLLENTQTILDAAAQVDDKGKIDFLIQMLQALTYLHRRGITHHDLKPANVLIIRGKEVKVLDFGLATKTTGERRRTGTLAYMAPEVLRGGQSSVMADLYAVGIIAYECFAGRHPFDTENITKLIQATLTEVVDVSKLPVAAGLQGVIGRLLMKDPLDRYQSATDTIRSLCKILGRSEPEETSAIRESFLQAAQFIGRDTEFGYLTEGLENALSGKGSTWLIGGESGVGKTRLLDELRTQALVRGAMVLRGQANREGSVPYLLWREALRYMCLSSKLSDLEAGVLKPIVPDIERLSGHDVPDAPELDPLNVHRRLLNVITDIFHRQEKTIVLLLDDLQWVTEESLDILRQLTLRANELPLLITCSYRDDERPELVNELSNIEYIKLECMDKESIAELSVSMLGEAGRHQEVLNLLNKETEGNVFFIVEVVRALAEAAGQLSAIGEITLPISVFTWGIHSVIQRKLNRLSQEHICLLQFAAIAGREINPQLLLMFTTTTEFDKWLLTCEANTILGISDNSWRFAHDKIREAVLDSLGKMEYRTLHTKVALAFENIQSSEKEYVTELAYHWSQTENIPKIVHYASLAGEQALKNGASTEAIQLISQALELNSKHDIVHDKLQLARWTHHLGEAYYSTGHLSEGRRYLQDSLSLLGCPYPSSKMGLGMAIFKQLTYQTLHRLTPGVFLDKKSGSNKEAISLLATRIYQILIGIAYLDNEVTAMVYYFIRMLNLAEGLGDAGISGRAIGYGGIAVILSTTPLKGIAEAYANKAEASMKLIDDVEVKTFVWETLGVYANGIAQFERAKAYSEKSRQLAVASGNIRKWAESSAQLNHSLFWLGLWDQLLSTSEELLKVVQKQDDKQIIGWALIGYAWVELYRGQFDKALSSVQKAQDIFKTIHDSIDYYLMFGIITRIYLRQGNMDLAEKAARALLPFSESTSAIRFDLIDAHSGLAEFYLTQWENQPSEENRRLAKTAYRNLWKYAKSFALGESLSYIYRGWYHQIDGEPDKAIKWWEKGIKTARKYNIPYEEALGHYFMGRSLPDDDPARREHLTHALTIFERLGATWNMKRTLQELSNGEG